MDFIEVSIGLFDNDHRFFFFRKYLRDNGLFKNSVAVIRENPAFDESVNETFDPDIVGIDSSFTMPNDRDRVARTTASSHAFLSLRRSVQCSRLTALRLGNSIGISSSIFIGDSICHVLCDNKSRIEAASSL